jgi:dipeptidyl aminopeptidase/acylaminoacyl peptidase
MAKLQMRTLFIAIIAFCAVSTNMLHAQEVLTADRLLEIARVGSPVVSPNGQTVVYTISTVNADENNGKTSIYRKDLSSGGAIELTEGSSPIWRPDGAKIGYMRGGQLWEMNPDGSSAQQVTDIDGGIANVMYAPNGQYLSFTRNVSLDETLSERHPDLPKAEARLTDDLMYRHWDRWHDGTYRHLFIAPYSNGAITGEIKDIMEGELFDTPLKPFGGASHIAWHPNSASIVYTSKKLTGAEAAYSTNSDLFQYEIATGSTVNLTEGNEGYDFYPAFSPNGRYLAWLSMETPMYEADRYRLMLHDFNSGEQKELSVEFDQNVNGQKWSADSKTIYFLSGTEATVQLFAYEMEPRRNQPNIRRITEGIHDYTGFDISTVRNRTELIAARMSMSAPVDLFRVNPTNGRQTQFTFANSELLENTQMGRVEKRWVTTSDEKQMLVWVIYPPNFDATKTYPALLYAQGGPQGTVSQFFSYRWNFQVMAANDYIVVAPNRRGLPSFGQDWNLEISGDWGGQAMRDLLSAIDNVAAEPFVDNDRLGAVGASFGGYSVFWLAGNHNNRFKTFISHAGVFHLESMYGETEEMFFVDHDLGGSYWEKPQPISYSQHSPHTYVANWNTPIMMIHGELDYRVPLGQSMQAFTAARRLGIPSRMLIFPNENHWILSPQNSLLWHREFYGWLDEWLK